MLHPDAVTDGNALLRGHVALNKTREVQCNVELKANVVSKDVVHALSYGRPMPQPGCGTCGLPSNICRPLD